MAATISILIFYHVIALTAPVMNNTLILLYRSLTGYTLRVIGGSLQTLTVDGNFPVSSTIVESIGIIYPGERVDLLLEWNQDNHSRTPRLDILLDPE